MRNVDIQVSFNGESRSFPMCENFQVLYDRVAASFHVEKFALKYRDADGDLITVTTDVELQHAYGVALFFQVFPLGAPFQLASPQQVPVLQHPVAFYSAPPMVAPPSPVVYQQQHQYTPPMVAPPSPVVYQQTPMVAPHYAPPSPVVYQQVPMVAPVPGFLAQPPVVGAPVFKDKAELKKFKRACGKEEWQAFKSARKAEKLQRKMSARSFVPVPMSPSAGNVYVGNVQAVPSPHATIASGQVAVPVPFPHSIIACDAFKRVLMPGEQFSQTWRIRNEGIYAWPAGMIFMYDPCQKHHAFSTGVTSAVIDRSLGPKEDVMITIHLTAPNAPGKYVGLWRLSTPDQWKFGKKTKIVVKVPTPDQAERALQKAVRKAKLSEDEKVCLKETKKAAKLAAKQAYWEAKKNAKKGDAKQEWKEAKKAAKMACREAKRKAGTAHRNAKLACKEATQVQMVQAQTASPMF